MRVAPNRMGTRSMFGDQVNSKKASSPSYGFGSATRDHAARVFASKELAKATPVSITPGPAGYTLHGSVGKQESSVRPSSAQWQFGTASRFSSAGRPVVDQKNPGPGAYGALGSVGMQTSSKKRSMPIYGFGTSTRDNRRKVFVSQGHNKELFGVQSPGPSAYVLRAAVGKQVSSKRESHPAWVFGSANRFNYEDVKRAAATPGPGAYSHRNAVSTQVSSVKPSAPNFGFGTSDRVQQAKVYMGKYHEKGGGKTTPGPGAYSLASAVGRQPLSKMMSSCAWGFGTQERSPRVSPIAFSTPGPGSYLV